jgi:hypothetical protein
MEEGWNSGGNADFRANGMSQQSNTLFARAFVLRECETFLIACLQPYGTIGSTFFVMVTESVLIRSAAAAFSL